MEVINIFSANVKDMLVEACFVFELKLSSKFSLCGEPIE